MICMYVCLWFPFTTFLLSFFYPLYEWSGNYGYQNVVRGQEMMVTENPCVEWKYRLYDVLHTYYIHITYKCLYTKIISKNYEI